MLRGKTEESGSLLIEGQRQGLKRQRRKDDNLGGDGEAGWLSMGSMWVVRGGGEMSPQECCCAQACDSFYKILDLLMTEVVVKAPCLRD